MPPPETANSSAHGDGIPLASEEFMRDRQHVVRLLGETSREIGLPAFVLAPLDETFGNSELNPIAIAVAMVTGAILIGGGIIAET